MNPKIQYLEYIIQRLIEWYREVNPTGLPEQGIDKLKVFKMVFFIATANSDESNPDLLRIFNNFTAMPYGPVELDLYRDLGNIRNYQLGRTLTINQELDTTNTNLDIDVLTLIDNSIAKLREIDDKFLLKRSFELVEISHKWFSWRHTYYNTSTNNAPMPIELIIYDTKYYN